MSKRSRRNYTGKPRHIVTERRDQSHERELLNAPAENFMQEKVVKTLMERLHAPDCTNLEAINIGLALQQFLRGDASLLSNMDDPQVAHTVNHIMEQRDKMDKAAEAFEQDRQKFIEQTFDRADKIRPVGSKRDQVIAKGAEMYREARERETAKRSHRRLLLENRLRNDPKILVNVEGVREVRMVSDTPQEVILPEIIGIMNRQFVLKPGPQMLPKILADLYEKRVQTRRENQARENAMRLEKNLSYNQVEMENARISKEFGSSRDRLPLL